MDTKKTLVLIESRICFTFANLGDGVSNLAYWHICDLEVRL